MWSSSKVRIGLLFLGLLIFLSSFIINFLAGFGARSGVFDKRPEDVTQKYRTPITPARWIFFLWDFLYFWFIVIFVYFLLGLWRRNAYEWMYTTPALLPFGYHVFFIINISFNIMWLFLLDREWLLSLLIISMLQMLTTYMMLFFLCQGLKVYGAWLSKYHNKDLWLFRILVQNGVAVYATWATLSTLLNMAMYLQHRTVTPTCDCALLALLLLLMELLGWFLLENLHLDEHARYILTIHPVVILWLTGILSNSESSDTQVYMFTVFILAVSCILFVVRVILVTWKHQRKQLYKNTEPSLSPVEISLTQYRLFL